MYLQSCYTGYFGGGIYCRFIMNAGFAGCGHGNVLQSLLPFPRAFFLLGILINADKNLYATAASISLITEAVPVMSNL